MNIHYSAGLLLDRSERVGRLSADGLCRLGRCAVGDAVPQDHCSVRRVVSVNRAVLRLRRSETNVSLSCAEVKYVRVESLALSFLLGAFHCCRIPPQSPFHSSVFPESLAACVCKNFPLPSLSSQRSNGDQAGCHQTHGFCRRSVSHRLSRWRL